jgi:hypothetical protein
MLLNEAARLIQLLHRQAKILSDLNCRFNPEFCFAIAGKHVDMHSRLLTGKEEKPESSFTKHCRAYPNPILIAASAAKIVKK